MPSGGDGRPRRCDVRVLVVSEDPKERLRAVSALDLRPGMEVTEVTSAAAVRDAILQEGEAYDVLVVDGDLQPRGGFALLYDLRAHAELAGLPPIPSLVMASREQDRWLGKWSGTNEVLLKPVDPFELARIVEGLPDAPVPPYGDRDSAAAQVAAALDGR